jgi:hypothetical protein
VPDSVQQIAHKAEVAPKERPQDNLGGIEAGLASKEYYSDRSGEIEGSPNGNVQSLR